MDWLTQNPIANMYGPTFLLFYGAVIAATLAAGWWLRGRSDSTDLMRVPSVPSAPDPYEIAYLRGGAQEVASAVVFALVQRGALRFSTERRDAVVERVADFNGQGHGVLSPIERRVLDYFTRTRNVKEVFRTGGLAEQLKPFCMTYEQRLQREQMLTTPDMVQAVRRVFSTGALLILLLGGYKLVVALSRGYSNVLFLILMAVVGIIVLKYICRLPRLTRRGRTYLERLKLAFDGLNARPRVTRRATADAGVNAFDPSLLMMVSLFGAGALAGTAYDFYPETLRRQQADGGGGGSGGDYSSSSSSSDGTSSDGGGSSCGGGGCGGCGGGCGG